MSASFTNNKQQPKYSEVYLETGEAFLEVRESWNNLAETLQHKSVFFRHEWYWSAWQWLRHESKLLTILVYENKILVAACPFVIRQEKYKGLHYKSLEFLTVPDTQLNDVLIKEGCETSVLSFIRSCLTKRMSEWDVLSFSKVYDGSKLYANLASLCVGLPFSDLTSDSDINPGIKLDTNWDDYYATRSRRLKKGNNHVANKLKKYAKEIGVETDAEIEVVKLDASHGKKEIEHALAEFVKLSSKSWKNTTGMTLDRQKPQDFINQITKEALENDWLSIWILLIDKKYAAAEYQLSYHHEIAALRADYDSDLEALSPGTYLNWKLLIELFATDLKYYSMGPGDNSYKLRWANETKIYHTIEVYSKSLKGRSLYWIRVKLKALYNRFF